MTKFISFLHAWMTTRARQDRGVTMIEYALMAAVVAVLLFAAFNTVGTAVSNRFGDIATDIWP